MELQIEEKTFLIFNFAAKLLNVWLKFPLKCYVYNTFVPRARRDPYKPRIWRGQIITIVNSSDIFAISFLRSNFLIILDNDIP